MQTLTLFLLVIVIVQNFNNRSQIKKLKKKVSDQQIPYDHYSHLCKAYVDYYKWLSSNSSDKLSHSISTFKLCLQRLEEYFNESEK